jgi:hypothetical protein
MPFCFVNFKNIFATIVVDMVIARSMVGIIKHFMVLIN